MAWLSGGYTRRLPFTCLSRSAALTKPVGCIHIGLGKGRNAQDIRDVINHLGINKLRLAITKSDGASECYVEIAHWDISAKTATLFFNTDETIGINVTPTYYLYYGIDANDNIAYVGETGSTVARNVWTKHASYVGVYHFQQAPEYSLATIKDSICSFDLVAGSGVGDETTAPIQVDGMFGKAVQFDGVNDTLQSTTVNQPATNTYNIIIEAIFSLKSVPASATATIMRHHYATVPGSSVLLGFESAGSSVLYKPKTSAKTGNSTGQTISTDSGVWNYYGSCTFSGSIGLPNETHVFRDTTMSAYPTIATYSSEIMTSASALPGIIHVGGGPSGTNYFVNMVLQELRYWYVARATMVNAAQFKWNSESLLDQLNTYGAIEYGGATVGHCTVEVTLTALSGAVANPSIAIATEALAGSAGAGTIEMSSAGSYANMRANADTVVNVLCDAESYNFGRGYIDVPMPTVSVVGDQWNIGWCWCVVPAVSLQAIGSATTKEGGLQVPAPTVSAYGIPGQTGNANIIINPITVHAIGSGFANIQIPRVSVEAIGLVGSVGEARINIPWTVTALGATGTTGEARINIPMLTLHADGLQSMYGTVSASVPAPIVVGFGATGQYGRGRLNIRHATVSAVGAMTVYGYGNIAIPKIKVDACGSGGLAAAADTYVLRYSR